MKNNNRTKTSNQKEEVLNNDILTKIKEMYNLMCEAEVVELKTSINEFKLRIKRFTVTDNIGQRELTFPSGQPFVIKQQVKEELKETEQIPDGTEEITSPLNGVFYRSPSPGAPPFVKEGDIVQPGSVLCIVEAMKIMNEIKSDKKCKIIKVLCENGSSVTAGTKLFLVEPL
ncbi:MAG: acetyl-CoA carboxylase, biotin carboxyl carrier protein [Endomicrobia bacterium]|nr:acetyl-CoA carboxylase, biotin carboxyl carrier protein [Endomicrobiia bacterium]MCX7941175.1 acetyl-CoA carboxylase, biotin carboxyl carrier protein [Endomicrobiia bacterium]MDW8056207.1 biotin/lipoyl-containing protein [Elusimicrobiota bacterium]